MEIVKIYVFGFARIISHTRRSFLELMHVPNCLGNCTYLKYYIMKVDHYLPQGCPKYYTYLLFFVPCYPNYLFS